MTTPIEVVYVKCGHDATSRVDGREQPGKDFDETGKVAVWDVDPDHAKVAPELYGSVAQSVLIHGDKENPGKIHKVAATPGILDAIAQGRLIRVDPPKEKTK